MEEKLVEKEGHARLIVNINDPKYDIIMHSKIVCFLVQDRNLLFITVKGDVLCNIKLLH